MPSWISWLNNYSQFVFLWTIAENICTQSMITDHTYLLYTDTKQLNTSITSSPPRRNLPNKKDAAIPGSIALFSTMRHYRNDTAQFQQLQVRHRTPESMNWQTIEMETVKRVHKGNLLSWSLATLKALTRSNESRLIFMSLSRTSQLLEKSKQFQR